MIGECREVQDDLVLKVSNVSLQYKLRAQKSILKRSQPASSIGTLQVLNNISFSIRRGEQVALIGRNGAGKSSLIRVCSGGQVPSSGLVEVAGEPVTLSSNSPILRASSGWKNLELGLLARGVRPDVLQEEVLKAADFTELGEALSRPLRTYSSGMKGRIKFAVATTVASDLLLIDEGLSAGDSKFNEKARSRVEEVISKVGALLMVSHSRRQALEFCSRGIVLHGGRVSFDGKIEAALAFYEDKC